MLKFETTPFYIKKAVDTLISIIADTHTHTIASGHAYSTITENARAAADKGLKYLAITDHTTKMPDAPDPFYFSNLRTVPPELFGVRILRGCEVNILETDGSLDLSDRILNRLDWVIASMHPPVFAPKDSAAHTRAWLNIARNPLVDVIGHCGDARFPFDYERVIPVFGKQEKIVEINSHSFSARPGSPENCKEIALLCKKYRVPVVVSTDAHFWTEIGIFDRALTMLEEIRFPEELILNADPQRFAQVVAKKMERDSLPK